MPIKRKYSKKSRRRTNRRRRKVSKKRSMRPIIYHPGFPNQMFVKLEYSDKITLDCISGSIASYVFRGNSLYDPDYTGTGHQPYYHDQLIAIYRKYTVIGSKCAVKFVTDSADTSACILRPSSSEVAPANLNLSRERPDTRSVWVDNQVHRKMSYYRSTSSVLRVPRKAVMYDDEYQMEVPSETNPGTAFAWYWIIAAQPALSTATTKIHAYVHLTFYARISELFQQGQS